MVSFRFSALTWVLYTKDAKALAGYVSDPRSGEILKANVMVGDSWERSWIKKLAVLDMSDGQSAVMRHILGGNNKTTTITAPPPQRLAPATTSKEAIIGVEGDQHEVHDTRGGTTTRSLLHSHKPGKCQHAMATQNEVPTRLMRLLMMEAGKDQPISEVRYGGVLPHGTTSKVAATLTLSSVFVCLLWHVV